MLAFIGFNVTTPDATQLLGLWTLNNLFSSQRNTSGEDLGHSIQMVRS